MRVRSRSSRRHRPTLLVRAVDGILGTHRSNTMLRWGVVKGWSGPMSDDATDEDELLAQVAGGDMRALEALYRQMRVQVFAVALAVTGDRGTYEDVMQDT